MTQSWSTVHKATFFFVWLMPYCLPPQEVAEPDSNIDHSISEAHMIAGESKKKVKVSEMQFHPEDTPEQTDSVPSVAELKVPSVITGRRSISAAKMYASLVLTLTWKVASVLIVTRFVC